MFERFTHNARTAVVLAEDAARVRGQAAVDTGHLLSGLVSEALGPANSAAAVLAGLGIDVAALRRRADAALTPGSGAPAGAIPFTEPAKQVLLLSLREALRLRHEHVGTEHLLLGLISEAHGTAATVLNHAGVYLGRVRVQVERLPARQVQAPPAARTG
ncbi:Clp protease N-terminal domain-containing protein [Dactylosporangium sp. NPDC049525]|uniref:Clp protease N-terminal domain-containing protein n=1 Tax=Dactylosporangium sp. NPDC049525 TaxID=3154730 RepID=UPI003416514C